MSNNGSKRALRGRAGRMQGGRGSGRASKGAVRLWGRHAVEAALMNPERQHRKLWATPEGIESLSGDLRKGWAVFALGGYGRLLGRYADSPLVKDTGSRNQWLGGLGVAYSF